jgi:lysophospholipase L1-like esterase
MRCEVTMAMRDFLKSLMVVSALAGTVAMSQQTAAPAASATPKTQAQLLMSLEDLAGLKRYAADNAQLPETEKGRVVFFGDSITDAWGRSSGTFFPGKPYVNRGISGQTTPQMLVRFRQDAIDLHPEAVVILAGTNDIAGNTGPSTLEMIEDNLRSMADLARANGIHVILASVLPAADYPWRKGLEPAAKIKALNAWIAKYCAEKKLTYLDYYTAMAGDDGGMKPGISRDGVHPNAEGYAIMGPLAEKAIEKTLRKQP